jgi:hypothetical protein
MNRYLSKKSILLALIIGFAFSNSQITYPVFDWLDAMRDKLSEPILGKVTKNIDIDTKQPEPVNTSRRRGRMVKGHVAAPSHKQSQEKTFQTAMPFVLDIAEVFTQAYITEDIETPINRIGAHAGIKTGYQWFGRKISSRDIPSKLAKGVLVSSVMFAVHNLAAHFLYPNWLKERWWMKGIANDICTTMVMSLASNLFGISQDNE